jgi:adenosine deaminase
MDPLAEGHPSIKDVLTELAAGVDLDKIDSFFDLFPAIYAITSNPRSLRIATSAVLDSFLQPTNPSQPSQCSYIELRTTPRATPFMSRREYLLSVLEEIQPRGPAAALIVSLDRRMKLEVAQECAELAIELRDQGYPVVGVDLCGNPLVQDFLSE